MNEGENNIRKQNEKVEITIERRKRYLNNREKNKKNKR